VRTYSSVRRVSELGRPQMAYTQLPQDTLYVASQTVTSATAHHDPSHGTIDHRPYMAGPRYPAGLTRLDRSQDDAGASSERHEQHYGRPVGSISQDAYYNPGVALRFEQTGGSGTLTRSSTASYDSFETRSLGASSFTSYDVEPAIAGPSRTSSKYSYGSQKKM
jgi:hypothetical protein